MGPGFLFGRDKNGCKWKLVEESKNLIFPDTETSSRFQNLKKL